MAIYLENSMFIHIPKCGGNWVKQMIKNNVENFQYDGDPIIDSHNTPDSDLPTFAFIRSPAYFAHSLWHHRAKKSKWSLPFTWNNEFELEKNCGDKDYFTFMFNVAEQTDAVTDYYVKFIEKYNNVTLGRTEFLSEDFINILLKFNETFNETEIRNNTDKFFNQNGKSQNREIHNFLINSINDANPGYYDLLEKYGIHNEVNA